MCESLLFLSQLVSRWSNLWSYLSTELKLEIWKYRETSLWNSACAHMCTIYSCMCACTYVMLCKCSSIHLWCVISLDMIVLQKGNAHKGAKASQAVFTKDNRIFTTGFSKMSDRQYALWAEVRLLFYTSTRSLHCNLPAVM